MLVSAAPRWRMARCLSSAREGEGGGMRGGIAQAVNRPTSETCAIVSGEDNFAEPLILHTARPERTRLK